MIVRTLRALFRIVAFAGVTIPLYAGYLVTRRRWIVRTWARVCARVVGLRIRTIGAIPPPGYVVANHCGYLDVLLIGSRLDACFVAKTEIAGWPVLGWLASGTGTIYIDRKAARDVLRVGERIREAADAGRHVVLFPEAGSSDGSAVLPFRSALLEVAAADGRPVYPLALGYSTPEGEPAARESVCWWGGASFGPHLWRLLGLRRIDGWIEFLEPVQGAARRELGEKARNAISGVLAQRVGPV
jgi:1-acyl-sn-glycerol-3-phosphate acyltransferase